MKGCDALEIQYSKSAVKALMRMEKSYRLRIKDAIEGLTQKPPKGDIKPMEGKPVGRYRLRVGGYRVIYTFSKNGEVEILCILDIGSRGDVYK